MDKQKTVLVVEDSPVQAVAIGQLLSENGLRVLYALDGQDGVRMALANVPDAIVLDLEMPRMNGLDVCRCLKMDPQTVEIPVIMLTDYADRAGLVLAGIDRGAVDFIPKDDFADIVLLETLRQLNILEGDLATER
jgi:CheY-like chemotaxis protein